MKMSKSTVKLVLIRADCRCPSRRAGPFSILEWGQWQGHPGWTQTSPSFQLKKKIDFSVCFPLLLRIGASPINPSDILLHHLRSSALTTRLHEKHSRAGCQRTRAHCWMRLRVDPVVDLMEESAVCSLLCEDGVQAGLDAGSICQRLRRIMQASIMNDLVPGFRFPEDFCGFPTLICSCFHTPLGLSSLLLAIQRRGLLRSKCCEDVGSSPQMS